MKGAELLINTAVASGVAVCFANPGTTEMPLVEALDTVPGIRAVLGLFEGVCTGAADGYARMLDKPAMTLLHLGPGLANGIANLHNARRAHSPLFNVIGEHATWHLPADAPLTMDIEALARTVSGWQSISSSSDSLGQDTAYAIAAAHRGQVATLIVPEDHQWSVCREAGIIQPAMETTALDMHMIDEAARLLRDGGAKAALVLGGRALREAGLLAAARIRAITGCDLWAETFPARMERGAGLPDVQRIPYLPEEALPLLSPYETFILAGAREPVAFFGYQGMASAFLTKDQRRISLGMEPGVTIAALHALAEALNAPASVPLEPPTPSDRPALAEGPLTGAAISGILAALQPEGAIVVEEAITSSLAYYPLTAGAPRFSLLTLTGGAIGQGLPCALGAAVACPDRPVISFQADGSAMYTLQALWTQAREGLNITTLICSNHSYDILKVELMRAGNPSPGFNARKLTDLAAIDWVKLGEGLGIPSVAVRTGAELAESLPRALRQPGPHVIEMIL